MSVLGKKWVVKHTDKNKSVIEKVMENRSFSFSNEMTDFYDPFLFVKMPQALERLEKAIKDQERVLIFGDYDVDGITGTAILYSVLNKLSANVSYRIPHREKDGYGLSEKYVREFKEKNVKLIITVDCGISCVNPVILANEYGIDTIITDHHTIPKILPQAFAILHPKQEDSGYPYTELTGAGVALKFAHALVLKFFPKDEQEAFLERITQLAALGTVADLGPLTGENRFIVKKGLKNLIETSMPGLKHLLEVSGLKQGKEMDAQTIGFRIAPRINAAGRIGNPYRAISLLLQDREGEEVVKLSEELENLNTQRQQMTRDALLSVEEMISSDDKPLPYLLTATSENWHMGIVGLVAGRLVEKYARPAIIMKDMGDTLVASARSPEFFNIMSAIEFCNEYLESYGGHSMAAGFSLKKEYLEKFLIKIENYAKEQLEKVEMKPVLNIDCMVSLPEINDQLMSDILNLAPFGIKNEQPLFLLSGISPKFISLVGKEQRHLKFVAEKNGTSFAVIGFNFADHVEPLKQAQKINIAFHLNKNEWNDRTNLQLQLVDMEIE